MTLTFKTKPFDHQKELVERIVNNDIPFYGLFLEQGLGKTKIALDIAHNRIQMSMVKKVWIMCPTGLVATWKEQIRIHTNWGEPDQFRNYDFITYGMMSVGKGLPPSMGPEDLLIIDESHYLKTPTSSRTKYFLKFITDGKNVKDKLTGHSHMIAKNCPQILTLSGTPIAHDERDLFIQCVLLHTPIGKYNFRIFLDMYFEGKRGFGGHIVEWKVKNKEGLLEEFKGVASFLKKKDCMDLPPKLFSTWYYDMTNEQRWMYSKLIGQTVQAIQEGAFGNDKELFVKKSIQTFYQICSGYVTTVDEFEQRTITELVEPKRNPKLEVLRELVGAISAEPIVVYVGSHYDLTIVSEALQEFGAVGVRHGKLSAKDKDKAILEFKSGTIRILVATIQSSFDGLNLENACTMIYYSTSNRLLHFVQAEDRIHRASQQRDCHYYYIAASPADITGNFRGGTSIETKRNYEFADLKLFKHFQAGKDGTDEMFNLFKDILMLNNNDLNRLTN